MTTPSKTLQSRYTNSYSESKLKDVQKIKAKTMIRIPLPRLPPIEVELSRLDQDLAQLKIWWETTKTDPIPETWVNLRQSVWERGQAWEREDFRKERNPAKPERKKAKAVNKYRGHVGDLGWAISKWKRENGWRNPESPPSYWSLPAEEMLDIPPAPRSYRREEAWEEEEEVLPAYEPSGLRSSKDGLTRPLGRGVNEKHVVTAEVEILQKVSPKATANYLADKMAPTLLNLLCLAGPPGAKSEAPPVPNSIGVEFYILHLELRFFAEWWKPTDTEPLPRKWHRISANVKSCRDAWLNEGHAETERERREIAMEHRSRIERLGLRIERLKSKYGYWGDDPSPRYRPLEEETLPPYREVE
ncbi:hypothetical protein BDZ45DRAFT_806783 [Acephala macrosclerotiorum]|nr:hypothetical protein BDZ45DRAFT_806783 [Acephala macrosclerotiorum]